MRSLQLLTYKAEEGALVARARDYNTNWITATTVLDEETFMAAENSYNLFTVAKNNDAAADEERNHLAVRCHRPPHPSSPIHTIFLCSSDLTSFVSVRDRLRNGTKENGRPDSMKGKGWPERPDDVRIRNRDGRWRGRTRPSGRSIAHCALAALPA